MTDNMRSYNPHTVGVLAGRTIMSHKDNMKEYEHIMISLMLIYSDIKYHDSSKIFIKKQNRHLIMIKNTNEKSGIVNPFLPLTKYRTKQLIRKFGRRVIHRITTLQTLTNKCLSIQRLLLIARYDENTLLHHSKFPLDLFKIIYNTINLIQELKTSDIYQEMTIDLW